eukprot:gene9234-12448_t
MDNEKSNTNNPMIILVDSDHDSESNMIQSNMEEDTNKSYLKQDLLTKVYVIRWLILILYSLSVIANAMTVLTWSPIAEKANSYFNSIGISAINLLTVICQIMYFPGTLLSFYASEKTNLRIYLIIAGFLTCVGNTFRLIGAVGKEKTMNNDIAYFLILLGTTLIGLAQPFYVNLPAKIASTWFPLNERDIATTLCFLAHSFGTATGLYASPLFVTNTVSNVEILRLIFTQFMISLFALILILLFFHDKPPLAPSRSAHIFLEDKLVRNEAKNRTFTAFVAYFYDQMNQLFRSGDYMQLLVAFTIQLSNINAFAGLLQQLPGNYSTGQIGLTGAAFVGAGVAGTIFIGFIIEWSKAYRTVLKFAYSISFLSWIFFLINCRPNNFALFIFGAVLVGITSIPSIPATIVSAVECAYPVPEETTIGVLYISANILSVICTFIGQGLLAIHGNYSNPFFPFGIWVFLYLLLGLVPIYIFKGKYHRFEKDSMK